MAKITTTAKRLAEYMRIFDKRQVDILEEVQPLCEELGIKMNKSDLSQYLSGKVEPGSDKIYLLSVAFGLNPAWLMGYDVPSMYQDSGHSKPDVDESKKPIPEDELDNEIINLLQDLSPQEIARVVDFVAGLKAARAGEASRGK